MWILIFHSYSVPVTNTMTIEFCYLIFVTIDFYVVNDFIIPRFFLKRKYLLFALTTIIVIAVSAWLRALIAVQMNVHYFHGTVVDFKTLYLNSVINISLWVLLVAIIKMLIDRTQTQQQIELMEKERIKNELDYLKAQINPHTLFNSLNTIYGHIDKANQTARDILLQFSELLKYQLYECGAEKVNLENEVGYIKNYAAFQRLRKDDKLIVNIETDNIEPGLKIAPLLIIVLIENAFKFVSGFSDKENRISIKIFTKNNLVYCSIVNTSEIHHHSINKNPGGIGIVNLKRRLELLYQDKFSFTVKNEHDFYKADLTINLA